MLNPLSAQVYRPTFLAVSLLLTFLVFRATGRTSRAEHPDEQPALLDWVLGVLALVAVGYAAINADEVFRRAADPEAIDIAAGVISVLLILEATRRTVGWILPAICFAFLAYAYLGGLIPDSFGISHKGYGVDRLVGQTYMGLEGIFGIPLDVAATYIVLFTLYGAVLEYSGAARFFIQLSYAAFGASQHRPGADDHAGRLPARHGLRLRRRDHGHARLRRLAAAAQGRLPEGRGRRHPRRGRHRRDPVAADARRRRVHHRRVPGGELLQGAASTRWCRRSCTTSGSCSRSRPTRAA